MATLFSEGNTFNIHANDKKNYINVFQVLLEVLEANNMKLGSQYSRNLVGVVGPHVFGFWTN